LKRYAIVIALISVMLLVSCEPTEKAANNITATQSTVKGSIELTENPTSMPTTAPITSKEPDNAGSVDFTEIYSFYKPVGSDEFSKFVNSTSQNSGGIIKIIDNEDTWKRWYADNDIPYIKIIDTLSENDWSKNNVLIYNITYMDASDPGNSYTKFYPISKIACSTAGKIEVVSSIDAEPVLIFNDYRNNGIYYIPYQFVLIEKDDLSTSVESDYYIR